MKIALPSAGLCKLTYESYESYESYQTYQEKMGAGGEGAPQNGSKLKHPAAVPLPEPGQRLPRFSRSRRFSACKVRREHWPRVRAADRRPGSRVF